MKFNYINLYRLLLALIVLPLIAISVHAAHQGNVKPIGTWKIEITAPNGQTYYPEATFTSDTDGLKGSYYSPAAEETHELEDVSLKTNSELHFTLNHPQLTVKYLGRISGKDMKGMAHIDYQGQSSDVPFSATRESKNSSPTVVGIWKFESSINGDTYHPTVSINEREGSLVGTYTAGYNGEDMEMNDIKVEDNQLSFSALNNSFTLNYTGNIEGDEISGTMTASSNEGSMDGSFSGTRNSD